MSFMYPAIGGTLLAVLTVILTPEGLIASRDTGLIILITTFTVGSLAWLYSPLPDHNNGFGAEGMDAGRYWGFFKRNGE